jgi:hypothetical protein
MPKIKTLETTGARKKMIKLSDFRKATAGMCGELEIVVGYEMSDGEEVGWLGVNSVDLVEFEGSGRMAINITAEN